MKRTLLLTVCALGLIVAASACTPIPGSSRQQAVDAIARYFPEQRAKAERVATCESGMNPAAVSPGGGNWGLFQINTVHKPMVARMGYSWSQITNAYVNAKVARVIYDDADRRGSGWQPWSCGYA